MHSLGFLTFLLLGCLTAAEHWAVTENGITCIVVDSVPSVHVKFDDVHVYDVQINGTNTMTGKCVDVRDNTTVQTLEVRFFPNGVTPVHATDGQEWTLNLVFGSDETKGAFQLIDYQLTTAPQSSLNGSIAKTFKKASDADVNAHDTNGFKCSTTELSLENESSVIFKDLRAIAFARLNGTDFPAQQQFEQCMLDSRTSDIVPIIVGACLAGLVVIVLVAYLIGRARAKRQGYASV